MYLRGLVHLASSAAPVALQVTNFAVQSEVVGLQTGFGALSSLEVYLHALERSLRLLNHGNKVQIWLGTFVLILYRCWISPDKVHTRINLTKKNIQ